MIDLTKPTPFNPEDLDRLVNSSKDIRDLSQPRGYKNARDLKLIGYILENLVNTIEGLQRNCKDNLKKLEGK